MDETTQGRIQDFRRGADLRRVKKTTKPRIYYNFLFTRKQKDRGFNHHGNDQYSLKLRVSTGRFDV